MTFLQILWFSLVFLLIAVYFVLDGFDLGIGVLYPGLKRDKRSQMLLLRIIGPIWDGNEVWLITAGGALFAAFAPAYAMTFSGFYLAIMFVLFGLIMRAVSVEYRAITHKHQRLCDVGFFVGSLLPALLFGVAIGNILGGVTLDANGDYTGSFFGLLKPFALVCGLLGLAQFIAQGGAWIALKSAEPGLRQWGVQAKRVAQVLVLILFALATIMYFAGDRPELAFGAPAVLRWLFVVVIVCGTVMSLATGSAYRDNRDLMSFIFSSLVCVGLVGLTAASLFPAIVPATDPALSITIANAASSQNTLTAMTIIACIGVPLVLVYHIVIYRTFSGRLGYKDVEH